MVNTPPIIKRSVSFLGDFKQARGSSTEHILSLLEGYRDDLRGVYETGNRTLLHVSCEIMDFRVAKELVERYRFEVC